jgi:hypothetical protein
MPRDIDEAQRRTLLAQGLSQRESLLPLGVPQTTLQDQPS